VRPSPAATPAPTAVASVRPEAAVGGTEAPRRAADGTLSKLPATAREACGSRILIALALCMDRECKKAEYANGADCRRYLAEKRQRDLQRGVPPS
jgi:hypothetical protein